MKRFLSVFRTNEPQVTSVLMFSILNCLAASKSDDWRIWSVALGFWPAVAFAFNLIDPIPTPKGGDNEH